MRSANCAKSSELVTGRNSELRRSRLFVRNVLEASLTGPNPKCSELQLHSHPSAVRRLAEQRRTQVVDRASKIGVVEGRDRDRKDAGNERKAFYNDLPRRNYRLPAITAVCGTRPAHPSISPSTRRTIRPVGSRHHAWPLWYCSGRCIGSASIRSRSDLTRAWRSARASSANCTSGERWLRGTCPPPRQPRRPPNADDCDLPGQICQPFMEFRTANTGIAPPVLGFRRRLRGPCRIGVRCRGVWERCPGRRRGF
jgi:hypothetical protein